MIQREPHFCAHCQRTTYWEVTGKIITCIGDNRLKLIGCATMINTDKIKRYVGECLCCKRMRRAHRTPEGKFICLYCWTPMAHASEVEFGDLSGL